VSGVIQPVQGAASPLGGTCVAFALELRNPSAEGGPVLLRDAASSGFEVATADGRRVRIAPGRVHLEGALSLSPDDIDVATLGQYLHALVPPSRHERNPFPYREVRALLLHAGDRIEVRAPLREVFYADGAGEGYRDSPTVVEEPAVVPFVLLLQGREPAL